MGFHNNEEKTREAFTEGKFKQGWTLLISLLIYLSLSFNFSLLSLSLLLSTIYYLTLFLSRPRKDKRTFYGR